MSELRMLWSMFDPKSFRLPPSVLHPSAAGVVIHPSGSLVKELVSLDDLSYGRFGDRRDMRLFTVLVHKRLELLFAHSGVLLPHLPDPSDDPGIYTHPSDLYWPCGVGNERLKMPIVYLEPPLPYMDEFSIYPKGLLRRFLPIGVVKPQYPMPLLRHLVLAEPPKAMEHLFNPPIASYPTKDRVRPCIMVHLHLNVKNVS